MRDLLFDPEENHRPELEIGRHGSNRRSGSGHGLSSGILPAATANIPSNIRFASHGSFVRPVDDGAHSARQVLLGRAQSHSPRNPRPLLENPQSHLRLQRQLDRRTSARPRPSSCAAASDPVNSDADSSRQKGSARPRRKFRRSISRIPPQNVVLNAMPGTRTAHRARARASTISETRKAPQDSSRESVRESPS